MLSSGIDARELTEAFARRGFTAPIFLDRVDSTNDELKRRAASGAPARSVVLAAEQTAGRGRRERQWHSARGLGLYVSVLFRPTVPGELLGWYGIAGALAACRACRISSGREIRIRWPNDLTHRGRKLAGVLVEARSTGSRVRDLILGCGINLHHRVDDFPAEIRERATSMALLGQGAGGVSAVGLLTEFVGRLFDLELEIESKRADRLAASFDELADPPRGRTVRVPGSGRGEESEIGRVQGLDSEGGLRIRRRDGTTFVVRQAESIEEVREERCC